MAVCSVCGFDNMFGALVCAQCYHLLAEVKFNTQTTTMPNRLVETQKQPVPEHHAVDMSMYGPNVIVMLFDSMPDPLVVYVTQQAVLGRRTTDHSIQPRIDLSPYGAYEKGISRVHAVIRRTQRGVFIEDLGSSNGSQLNGERLAVHMPTQVTSGDRLTLGMLSFEIFFK